MLRIATYSLVIDIGILAPFAIGFGIFRGYSFGSQGVYKIKVERLQ